jgi:nucleoside-diphosphate-sugar epimerase
MYSSDLARVIKYCIDNDITDSFNVAPMENLSIKEIAEIALDVINPKYVKYIRFDNSKPDGQFRKDVSNEKLHSLIPNFKFISLRDGIRMTYDRVKSYNFNNYDTTC